MRMLPLIAVVTVLAGTAFGPTPTAAAAPPDGCAARVPILGDYDGDTVPDTAIGALGGTGARFWVQPSGGGPGAWVSGTSFADLDLDGDACSDAVVTDAGGTVRVLHGTKHGLDQSGAMPVPVPQTDGLSTGEALRISAIGMRHHGYVQVVVAGVHVRAGKESQPFVNISTRQSTGEFAPPLTYRGAIFGKGDAAGFATPTALSGSGTSFVVGAPATSVRGHAAAGAAYLFAGLDDGSYWIEPVSQDSWKAGKPETGDRFGASVSIRGHWIAIGVPGESIGNDSRTGLVQPLYWDGENLSMRAYRAIHQDLSGVPGTNEDGDNFGREVLVARGLTGSGSYDVLISAREKIGKQSAAGSVTLANLTKAKFRTYHQATAGVPGSPGSGDEFGTLATLRTSPQLDTVLIGAPGEDATGCLNCGSVIRSDSRKLSSHTAWKLIAPPGTEVSGTTRWGRGFARS